LHWVFIGKALSELYQRFAQRRFNWRRKLALKSGDCGGTLRCNTQPSPTPLQFCD
jgi:hypothetical protein